MIRFWVIGIGGKRGEKKGAKGTVVGCTYYSLGLCYGQVEKNKINKIKIKLKN
jgi:hypothetical protein